jgi:N-acetylglucosaminyldiphosphoundecaprenol N-acetyl-beta-D-mannosaminyltransferase
LGAEQANSLSWKNHWEGVKKIYASLDSGLPPDAAVGSSSRFCRVLGSELFVTDYSELSSPLLGSIGKSGKPLAVDFANTQIVTMRRHDHGFAKLSECMDLSLPDGMPLVWAMNRKGAELKDRIYGPTFTREFLKSCPGNLTHYLVGGSEECGKKFQERMLALNPSLQFIGSTHAKCTSEGVLEDDQAVLREIQEKRPDFIWVGLGTPKQYGWINRIKPHLDHGVLLAVGFAFDVNAGMKSDAPLWMQRIGMTWAYRMACEPRRLIGRYLKWNTLFLYYIIFEEVEPLWNQLKLMVRNSFMKVVDLFASEIRDYVTGESLGRGLLFGWGRRANLIGHSGLPPLIPRFLPRKRLTYWKQPIGFTSHPRPDYQRLGNPPISDKESARVTNVVLTHFHDNDALREMLGNWKEVCRVEDLWIAFGGTFNDFESLDYPRKVFIEGSSLRVEDNQREKQSYTGIFRAMAAVVEREMPDYIYFSEYDHVPLVSDLNCRQVDVITSENADVMGHWLYRVDGTSNHHMLYHETDPAFLPFWKSVSRREDTGVVLSMLGTGSFWTREAYLAIARNPQEISCYLELYLPTLVHHLGFRVRGWNDREHLLSNLPSRSISIELGREQGCWTVHPIKNFKK